MDTMYLTGGYGTPMRVFQNKNGKNKIILRESVLERRNQKVTEICRDCDVYPCNEGVASFFLTTDGRIRFERLEGLDNPDFDLFDVPFEGGNQIVDQNIINCIVNSFNILIW